MHRRNENFCTPEEQEGLIQRQIDESYRSVCSSPWSWKLWLQFAVRQQEQQGLAAVADPRINQLQQRQQREQEQEETLQCQRQEPRQQQQQQQQHQQQDRELELQQRQQRQ